VLALCVGACGSSAAADRYVALGDSYSAGTGTGDPRAGAICGRSRYAYPSLVAERRGLRLAFAACAGATTTDVLVTQSRRLTRDTRWVTITIGGNDVGFAEVVGTCAIGATALCTSAIVRARDAIRRRLPAKLDAVYRRIRRRSPRATTIVLGYPRLFTRSGCDARTSFTAGAVSRLNDAASLLRDTIRARVRVAGSRFRFVDATAAFAARGVCSADPWINGLTSPLLDSFHPNRGGHRSGYTPLVLRAMR
jgi:lysophospholipase L1-like esterase